MNYLDQMAIDDRDHSHACRRPTARKYEDVQRHSLRSGERSIEVFSTELTRLQRRILQRLGMPKAYEA
jgi:hypothetical protein